MNASPRFRRGDTSPLRPGLVFSCYNGKYERWVTAEHWKEIIEKTRRPERKRYLQQFRCTSEQIAARKSRYAKGQEKRRVVTSNPNRYHSGDPHPTNPGLIFWRYENHGYESWVTPAKLKQIRKGESEYAIRIREAQMRDPDMAATIRAKENAYARSRNRQRAAYQCRRRQTNINAAIAARLTCRVSSALRVRNVRKGNKTSELTGCSMTFLRAHLESKFKSGMSWENRSEWHIDHHVPLNAFQLEDPAQQKIAFNWRNLRPLWGSENQRKSDKIEIDGKQISVRTLRRQNIIPFPKAA